MKLKIKFTEFAHVNRFNRIVNEFINSDIDIESGRYIIDAKSIMALYTLDLSKEVDVKIHTDDEKELLSFKEAMKEFEA